MLIKSGVKYTEFRKIGAKVILISLKKHKFSSILYIFVIEICLKRYKSKDFERDSLEILAFAIFLFH